MISNVKLNQKLATRYSYPIFI